MGQIATTASRALVGASLVTVGIASSGAAATASLPSLLPDGSLLVQEVVGMTGLRGGYEGPDATSGPWNRRPNAPLLGVAYRAGSQASRPTATRKPPDRGQGPEAFDTRGRRGRSRQRAM